MVRNKGKNDQTQKRGKRNINRLRGHPSQRQLKEGGCEIKGCELKRGGGGRYDEEKTHYRLRSEIACGGGLIFSKSGRVREAAREEGGTERRPACSRGRPAQEVRAEGKFNALNSYIKGEAKKSRAIGKWRKVKIWRLYKRHVSRRGVRRPPFQSVVPGRGAVELRLYAESSSNAIVEVARDQSKESQKRQVTEGGKEYGILASELRAGKRAFPCSRC